MAKLVCVSIYIFIIVLGAACGQRTPVPPVPPGGPDTPEPMSKIIDVRVYFDGSGSMEGFVKPTSDTNYKAILKAVRSAINTGWEKSAVSSYRFAENIVRLGQSAFLDALLPSFYQTTQSSQYTRIDKIFDDKGICEQNNSLTIIITDLFQNRADIQTVVDKLKQKGLSRGLAVGLVGIKSQFSGNVCEVGERNRCFPYTEISKYERFRPFYILVVGRHSDTIQFFEHIHLHYPSILKEQTVVFSPYMVAPIGSFDGAQYHEQKGMPLVDNIVPSENSNKRVAQFSIRRKAAFVEITPKIKFVPFVVQVDMSKLDVEFINQKLDRLKGFKLDSDTANAVNIKVVGNKNSKEFLVKMKVASQNLPGKGVYRCSIVIRPSMEGIIIPEWWRSWNMDMSKIPLWIENSQKFEGWTTANLSLFLQNLALANIQTSRPQLARLFFYLQY